MSEPSTDEREALPVADCGHIPTWDPDGRTATCHTCERMWPLSYLAARRAVDVEAIARVIDPRAWDDSWFWDCDPPLPDDRIEDAQRAQIERKDSARTLAAAVVAYLAGEGR